MNNTTPLTCPLCKNRLYQRKSGTVCKNHTCFLYWKMAGWSCFENNPKIWIYTDKLNDKHVAWDIKHNYPPRKANISKRHVSGMLQSLSADKDLCFVIPGKYCTEVMQQ